MSAETIKKLEDMAAIVDSAEIEEIEEGGKNYQTSVYYMDIVSELEKMGDFMINISQTLENVFVKR